MVDETKRSEDRGAAGIWARWVGVALFAMLGIAVFSGGLGLLGLQEHPMRTAIGWAFLGYAVLRAVINIILSRAKRPSRIEIH